MTEPGPAPDRQELLKPDAIWNSYETDHEVEKGRRRTREFTLPILNRLDARRVLEVGCGSGHATIFLHEQGLDAGGIDPHFRDDISAIHPFLTPGSGSSMPFKANSFDVALSREVVEHVGTSDGSPTPAADCWDQRQAFVAELCRVSRGPVVIATPNKQLPIDEHARDADGALGFRVHSPLEQATLSAGEFERLFRPHGSHLGELLDLTAYHALERVERKLGRFELPAARTALRLSTTPIIGRSPLNPHLLLRLEVDGGEHLVAAEE